MRWSVARSDQGLHVNFDCFFGVPYIEKRDSELLERKRFEIAVSGVARQLDCSTIMSNRRFTIST